MSSDESFCIIDSVKIDAKAFLSFFDEDFRLVKELEFRKALFRDGIEDEIKDLAWKFLFQYYPFNSTPRERLIKYKEKHAEYFLMKKKWSQIVETIENDLTSNKNYDSIKVPTSLPFDIKIEEKNDQIRQYSIYNKAFKDKNIEFCLDQMQSVNTDVVKFQTILKLSAFKISNSKLIEDIKQIDKDIERTSYIIEMGNSNNEDNKMYHLSALDVSNSIESLRNILITFVAFNQNVNESSKKEGEPSFNLGYTQGMNELASVFLSVFNEESVAYWCFSNFMLNDTYSTSSLTMNTTKMDATHVLKTNVAHYFSDIGLSKKLKYLSFLLSIIDKDLYKHLEEFNMHNLNFCHEWLLLYFKRCFTTTREYQRCFEMLASHYFELHTSSQKNINVKHLYSFDLFICLSLLRQMRDEFLNKCKCDTDVFEILQEFNKKKFLANNFSETFQIAENIFDKYCVNSHVKENGDGKLALERQKSTVMDKFKDFIFN